MIRYMTFHVDLDGWAELNGSRLSLSDISSILSKDPASVTGFGGEFTLRWNDCSARDHFGIMPGDAPPGTFICDGEITGSVNPSPPLMDLAQAIEIAVGLRSDEGIVALSGGVDSALVAHLAGRECLVVGMEGSHDLRRAREVSGDLGLNLEAFVIDPRSVEGALREVLEVTPRINPVDASIATTLYFVAKGAADRGYRRVIAGQGADELFGGYARYLQSRNLAEDLENDFAGLKVQLQRDQAVGSHHGIYFSLPYMDVRVVMAARGIPAEEKVAGGIRKRPLREVALKYMPASIACYQKKAMQYGSGVQRVIERLASRSGFGRSVHDYLKHLTKAGGRA
jgi:asparagine synthase (glutamine-hydrolysing)